MSAVDDQLRAWWEVKVQRLETELQKRDKEINRLHASHLRQTQLNTEAITKAIALENLLEQIIEVLGWTLGQMYTEHPPLRASGLCFYCDLRIFLREGHSDTCPYGRSLALLGNLKALKKEGTE